MLNQHLIDFKRGQGRVERLFDHAHKVVKGGLKFTIVAVGLRDDVAQLLGVFWHALVKNPHRVVKTVDGRFGMAEKTGHQISDLFGLSQVIIPNAPLILE